MKPQSTAQVSENSQGRYQQKIQAGKHQLLADEPVDMGGDDAGPTPHELMLSALGACTSITVRMYAERKALALNHISVELMHEKIETPDGKADRITRKIHLDGNLSAEERARLLEIANKCPVHWMLSGTTRVDSELV